MRFLIPVCSSPCSLASHQTYWFEPSFTNYDFVSDDHVSNFVVREGSMAIMAPKKKTSLGTVKNAVVQLKNVKIGQVVSVSGKVMTTSGLMTKPATGTVWAWVDIQDSEDGSKLRLKSFGPMAKIVARLKFLETFDFHNFKVETGFGVQ